jgi:hypothetical protein
MRKSVIGVVATLALSTAAVHAADLGVRPIYKAVPAAWVWEVGARYMYSSGKNWYDLYNDPTPAQLNSRLTYDGLRANSGEAFFRVDSPSAWFVKGYYGAGGIGRSNTLYDEDFPPAVSPYSKTVSETKGNLQYGNLDFGYAFYDSRGVATSTPVRFGAFLGYHYWREKVDAFGCTQIASGAPCAVGAVLPTRAVGPGVLVVTEQDTWNSFRAGGMVDIWFTHALKLTAEAAYARVWQKALDTHYLTFGSDPASGKGNGIQLEGILSYQVTELFNVGLGARWWHFNTTANETVFGGQLLKYQTERYGVFLQGSVKLGDNPPR